MLKRITANRLDVVNPSTHPERFRYCGIACSPSYILGQSEYCGRMIEKADGSIRAAHDTGYRFGDPLQK